jgi:hypothetical protein
MVQINPKRIIGRWTEGFALDFHTLSSEYIGDDEYGHPQFDTKRSEIGELLYRLKYREDKSVLGDIISTASRFIKSKNWPVDLMSLYRHLERGVSSSQFLLLLWE